MLFTVVTVFMTVNHFVTVMNGNAVCEGHIKLELGRIGPPVAIGAEISHLRFNTHYKETSFKLIGEKSVCVCACLRLFVCVCICVGAGVGVGVGVSVCLRSNR